MLIFQPISSGYSENLDLKTIMKIIFYKTLFTTKIY